MRSCLSFKFTVIFGDFMRITRLSASVTVVAHFLGSFLNCRKVLTSPFNDEDKLVAAYFVIALSGHFYHRIIRLSTATLYFAPWLKIVLKTRADHSDVISFEFHSSLYNATTLSNFIKTYWQCNYIFASEKLFKYFKKETFSHTYIY